MPLSSALAVCSVQRPAGLDFATRVAINPKTLNLAKEGGADQIKLEAAELAVTRVLDSNRTLESAAFSGGRTALHHAAVRGDHSLVLLLLERGCKPHAKVRTRVPRLAISHVIAHPHSQTISAT